MQCTTLRDTHFHRHLLTMLHTLDSGLPRQPSQGSWSTLHQLAEQKSTSNSGTFTLSTCRCECGFARPFAITPRWTRLVCDFMACSLICRWFLSSSWLLRALWHGLQAMPRRVSGALVLPLLGRVEAASEPSCPTPVHQASSTSFAYLRHCCHSSVLLR